MGGCFFPVVSLAVAAAYRRTDHRVFESARLAQGMRGVYKIGAIVLVPPALGAALLVFALTLTEFAVPQLLRVRTVGEAVYERIQEGELAAAAALSLPLLPVVVAAAALGAFILRAAGWRAWPDSRAKSPIPGRRLGPLGHLAAGFATLLAITPALILPCVSLGWLAATATDVSVAHARQAQAPPDVLASSIRSRGRGSLRTTMPSARCCSPGRRRRSPRSSRLAWSGSRRGSAGDRFWACSALAWLCRPRSSGWG